MRKWISVEERLPDEDMRVLCYCRGNQYDICHFQKRRNTWFDRSWNCYRQGYVTHWMPLPDQPKEEEIMKYNIKVGEKYLIGESFTETIKGTITGDTTAVYSRCVGEMAAYDFCDCIEEASAFDQVTACDYVRGIMERQMYGLYKGDIKLFDSEHEETIVHCNNENNAKVIARILDMDEAGHFITEESIWGKDGLNEKECEEEK